MPRSRPTINHSEVFVDGVTKVIRNALLNEFPKLAEVWKEMWDNDEIDKRKEILETHLTDTVSNVMEEILSKEIQTKEQYIARIEKLLDEIGKFEAKLGVAIPYDDIQTLPLHSMALKLNQKTAKYRSIVEERVNRYKHLRDQEAAICEAMGTAPAAYDVDEFPTEAEIERLLEYVQLIDDEKRKRTMTFMERRQRIIELHQLLGVGPELLLEKRVIEDDPDEFKLTEGNMKELENILNRLEQDLKCSTERREDLITTLQSMWDYLEEPKEKQEQFLRKHPGVTAEEITALRAELDRCKKEKSANIGKFVERIRLDIVAQWDKCLLSTEAREEFRVFKMAYYNEDIYDLHELELQRWQKFYTENEHIFELYNQHSALFEKLLELSGTGKNANRYQNRGGRLLQEERQRKQVAKELPKVEEKLRNAAAAFQTARDEPFTVFGKPIIQVLDEKWAANFDQKTIDKFRNGASASNARTPLAVKRPAITSAASTGAKISRCGSEMAINTRGRRRLYTANPEQGDEVNVTFQLEPSYADFQKTLASKLGASKMVSRSTELLTPSKVLRERNNILTTAKSSPALCPPPVTPLVKSIRRPNTPKPSPRTPASRTRLPVII